MPVITRLSAGKRDPSRVNVFVDGKFAFSLSADEVIKQALSKGSELSEESLAGLSSLSSEEKLFAKILNYLSYRPRSHKEVELRLRQYLVDHDNPQSVIIATVSRLEKLGYLDDLAFAVWFVQSRMSNRPRSKRHLTSELMGKGVSHEIISQVLTDHADDEGAIRALIAKKSSLPPDKLKSYLLRRGFSYDLIRSVLSEL